MGTIQKALTEYRDVSVSFINTEVSSLPLDYYYSALNLVKRLEGEYHQNPSSKSDVDDLPVILTGSNPNKSYLAYITVAYPSGSYTIASRLV